MSLNIPFHQRGSEPSLLTLFFSHNLSTSVMEEDITPARNSTVSISAVPGIANVSSIVLEGVATLGIADNGVNQPYAGVRDGYNSLVLDAHGLLDNEAHRI